MLNMMEINEVVEKAKKQEKEFGRSCWNKKNFLHIDSEDNTIRYRNHVKYTFNVSDILAEDWILLDNKTLEDEVLIFGGIITCVNKKTSQRKKLSGSELLEVYEVKEAIEKIKNKVDKHYQKEEILTPLIVKKFIDTYVGDL